MIFDKPFIQLYPQFYYILFVSCHYTYNFFSYKSQEQPVSFSFLFKLHRYLLKKKKITSAVLLRSYEGKITQLS